MKTVKQLIIQEFELPIEIEKDDGYVTRCPKWSDCYAQGDSIEEVINEISYVASSLIELYKEEGMPIPLKLKKESQKATKGFTFNIPLIVSTT